MGGPGHVNGRLYLVATPIGNLGDLGSRAREVLSRVRVVGAEDTRTARKLLAAIGAAPRRLVSVRAHNERKGAGQLADLIGEAGEAAYVTDAGTPGISDPGPALVETMRDRGIRVEPIPGPSAPIVAASVSGMCGQGFLFLGFLPRRKSEREARLGTAAAAEVAVVVHESPRRVGALLQELRDRLGADRAACVCRELTKLHEQVCAGTLGELAAMAESGAIPGRGEFTLVVAPAPGRRPSGPDLEDAARLCGRLCSEMPPGRAVSIVARHFNLPRSALYGRVAGIPGPRR